MSERLPAFIPAEDDEGDVDTLGFWHYGAYRGEWSGTTCWLADAPLPECAQSIQRDLPEMPPAVAEVKQAVAEGQVTPAVLLAPVVNSSGWAMLPIQGTEFDANPNFVAHIARTIPGGEWMLTGDLAPMVEDKSRRFPVLVYVVDGEARAMVSPSRITVEAAA